MRPPHLNLRSVTALSFLALFPAGSAVGGIDLDVPPPLLASPQLSVPVPESAQIGPALPVEPLQTSPGKASTSPFAVLPAAAFAAYATGTVVHADPSLSLDEDGEATGLGFDLALSDAAHASAPAPAVRDELGREAIPALGAGNSFGRGRGISLPAQFDDLDLPDFDVSPAEAKAPPTTGPVQKEASSPVQLTFVKAESFKSEALARAVPTGCVIGDDLARGAGSAADTDVDPSPEFDDEDDAVLSLEIEDPPPPRAVSQSTSRAALTSKPIAPGHFGVVAETRQTVAPVTFGVPGKDGPRFTLEIGGEYVLRAEADGREGDIAFGPENADDARPVARLFSNGDQIADLGFGERFPIEVGGETVGEIVIGDNPHAIGGDSLDKPTVSGTRVAAAVDLAVVRLDTGDQMRVGHMEVAVGIAPDGVTCPGIALDKRSEPATVAGGDTFGFTIRVSNPNDCVLDKVRVRDLATTSEGVAWKVATTLPRSTVARDGTLTFDDLGTLKTGETKTIRINAEIGADSAPGTISNQASATGTCAAAPVAGAASAVTTVSSPVVAPLPVPVPDLQDGSAGPGRNAAAQPPVPVSTTPAAAAEPGTRDQARSGVLARTGGMLAGILVGIPLVAGGCVLRRCRRRG